MERARPARDLTPEELAIRKEASDREAAEVQIAGSVQPGNYTRANAEDVLAARRLLHERLPTVAGPFQGMIGCTIEGQLVLCPGADEMTPELLHRLDAANPPGRLGWMQYMDLR